MASSYQAQTLHIVSRRHTVCIALLIASFWLCHTLTAQSYPFRIYGLEQGLPQSSVTCITQDHNGFLWVGTQVGLARFDGLGFKVYTVDDGLAANEISALAVDKKGTLWVGTLGGGLSRFDGPGFTTFTTAQGLPSNYIKALLVTQLGQFFAATEAGLACLQKDNTFQHVPVSDTTLPQRMTAIVESADSSLIVAGDAGMFIYHKEKLYNITHKHSTLRFIRALSFYGKDSLYIATNSGLWFYNTGTHQTNKVEQLLNSESILTLLSSKDGLWVGCPEGAAVFTSGKWRYFSQRNGLPGKYVQYLYCDRESNIWMGVRDGGLVKYSGFQFEHYGIPEGMPDAFVWSIHQDRRKRFWFGTDNGIAVLQNGVLKHFDQNQNLLDGSVNAFSEDAAGNLWFAYTYKGIGWFDGTLIHNVPLTINSGARLFRDVKCTPDGSTWVATTQGILRYKNGAIKQYTSGKKPEDNDVTNLYLDRQGILWGTTLRGLVSIRQDSLHRHTLNLGPAFNVVNDMTQAQDGAFWLVTDGGLVRYRDNQFNAFMPTKLRPYSQLMWSIQPDNCGHLWLGSTRGIYRFTLADSSFRFYSQLEGFLPLETNINAISKDSEGNIWFGTVKGAVKYNSIYDEASKLPPKPYITGVRLNNGTVDWRPFARAQESVLGVPGIVDSTDVRALEVPFEYNTISFDYIGLHFKVPENNLYKYRLAGLNDEFSPPTYRTVVDYTSLQPGLYTLEVHAANSDGVWTVEPARFSFEIMPPWYRTFWAYLGYLGCFLTVMYTVLRLRDRRYRTKTQQLEDIINLRTREANEKAAALEQALKEKEQTLESLKTTQRQLVQQEKMAALGSLVSNTAHDINTPLGVIRANSAYIESILPDLLQTLPQFLKSLTESEMQAYTKLAAYTSGQDVSLLSTRELRNIKSALEQQLLNAGVAHAEELLPKLIQCGVTNLESIRPLLRHPRLEEILIQAARLRQLRTNLLNISSSAEKTRKIVYSLSAITKEYNHTYRERIELKRIIEQVLQSYSTYLKARIRVYTKWEFSPFIIASPDEMHQVITHIVFNAIQALSQGGRLVIELSQLADKVLAQFTDDGPGIPPEAIPHIFEPFFTTKGSGEGSGLGLFITKKIIENHGGSIQLSSTPGRTTFSITLPLAQSES